MNISLDLRSSLSIVRDQGYRPTCLAFAASDAHGLMKGFKDWLSPEYLYHQAGLITLGWNTSNGISLPNAKAALKAPGQPLETFCPYQNVSAHEVIVPRIPKGASLHQANAELCNRSIKVATEIYDKALNNNAIVLAIRLTKKFHEIQAPFIVDVDESPETGRHAVLLAGLASHDTGRKFFLIKNSWGEDWADHGYAWLTEEYVNEFLVGTLEVREAV